MLIQMAAQLVTDSLVEHLLNLISDIQTVKYLLTLLVDNLALGIHHIVILQNPLSGLEMLGLNLPLGAFNGSRQDLGINGSIIIHTQLIEDAVYPVGPK